MKILNSLKIVILLKYSKPGLMGDFTVKFLAESRPGFCLAESVIWQHLYKFCRIDLKKNLEN